MERGAYVIRVEGNIPHVYATNRADLVRVLGFVQARDRFFEIDMQRRLGLGYPRAARLVDLLEELGIVGESVDGGRTRKVLIERGKDPFKEIIERRTKQKRS